MKKNEKYLIGGILLGAALAMAAIGYFAKKCTEVAEAHLFNLENQADAEEKIDELIPREPSEEPAEVTAAEGEA